MIIYVKYSEFEEDLEIECTLDSTVLEVKREICSRTRISPLCQRLLFRETNCELNSNHNTLGYYEVLNRSTLELCKLIPLQLVPSICPGSLPGHFIFVGRTDYITTVKDRIAALCGHPGWKPKIWFEGEKLESFTEILGVSTPRTVTGCKLEAYDVLHF